MRVSTYNVYALSEPGTKDVRYVGTSCDSVEKALSLLRSRARGTGRHLTKVERWVKELAEKNQVPEIELIESTTDSASKRRWVDYFTYEGYDLLNGLERRRKP